MLVGGHLPQQTGLKWLTIVPIAESRSSYNGLLLFVLIAGAALARCVRDSPLGVPRHPAVRHLGLRLPDASTATQYTAGSFAQPIRRVFGSLVFRAREEIHMPPPGDPQPARMHVHLRDLLWDALYLPVAKGVAITADVLNRVQFLTIRGYLTLVSGALVALLVVLAIWQ